VNKPLSPLNRLTTPGDGNAEFGWAMTLMEIVGIWYASDACAQRPSCEDIEAGFDEKAHGALTVQ
jgi:hypothetical protein